MHPTVDSSREGIPQPNHLSQQELSSSVYLSLKLRNGTEGFYSNNSGAGPAPDRAVTATEQRSTHSQLQFQLLHLQPGSLTKVAAASTP